MTRRDRLRPRLHTGTGITDATCASLCGSRRVAIVADASLGRIARPLADEVGMRAAVVRVMLIDARSVDDGVVERLAGDLIDGRAEVVVAVGGGTVIDAAAVAALAVSSPSVFAYALARAGRGPVVELPPREPSGIAFIAVPTTVGTSAESNAVAVLRTERGFRLLLGDRLRPDHAVLDAANYASLPSDTVREGALEALLRVTGARTSARADGRASSRAVGVVRALLAAGSATEPDALRIARLSAATQRAGVLCGRDPFASRHWYLANETAFVSGLSKMQATAAVIGSVWRRIDAGDSRWGDAGALQTFWADAACDAGLPTEPARGIDELLDRWRVPRAERPTDEVLAAAAEATRRTWGAPVPALGELGSGDHRRVLDNGRWAKPAIGGRVESLSASHGREEVKRNDIAHDHTTAAVRGARRSGGPELGELLPGSPGRTDRGRHRSRHRDLSHAACSSTATSQALGRR
ncbi:MULTISPECIES: iron-containing alcohol dehydrogenase [unclassified Microbacterium]|uniref:iron-containing alcohol dehydrogenase n=1 Tax=unclassified Microbacterium TaxID=2609290 RepID=UPI001782A599|nr:iron-containing alcohol dehydrogenase [Microbacterium sp. CFBP 8801]MBD8478374.1 iron-containing alcohol dehydrogenase [Microbacterium sp. CFBP 8794]MBD8508352.1 iron-containing alcohol dehydrogenase [Microbacterium sp. CFBP 8790]